jgi:hypothetical protein
MNLEGSTMLYGKCKFVCRFQDEACLPPFKRGSCKGIKD